MKEPTTEVRELVEQGKALYSVDNYAEAIKYLNRAIDMDPYYEQAYENLGVCYVMMDKYAEAKAVFNKYLLLNKKSGLIHFHLGNVALLEGNPDEAKAMYSKAELLGYNNPIMSVNLASYYEEQEDYEKSLEQYAKLLRSNPYAYDIMERKTQLLIRTGRFEEGLTSAKKMVQTDIDRFEGHHYVYIGLIMLKRYDEAKKYISDVIERFPDNQTALFDQARLYDLTGDAATALRVVEEKFPNGEKLPHVATLKLGLLLQLQRADEAISLVEGSDDLQKNADVLTMIYSLYFAKGNYSEAYKYCKKIQDLGEDSPQYYATWYFMALAESKMGKNDLAQEHFSKASEDYKSVCLEDPSHIDLYMYRALCEYQLGHTAEAKKLIEFLLALNSEFAAFHLAAAIIYEAAGEDAEAKSHKQIAAQLDPNMAAPLV